MNLKYFVRFDVQVLMTTKISIVSGINLGSRDTSIPAASSQLSGQLIILPKINVRTSLFFCKEKQQQQAKPNKCFLSSGQLLPCKIRIPQRQTDSGNVWEFEVFPSDTTKKDSGVSSQLKSIKLRLPRLLCGPLAELFLWMLRGDIYSPSHLQRRSVCSAVILMMVLSRRIKINELTEGMQFEWTPKGNPKFSISFQCLNSQGTTMEQFQMRSENLAIPCPVLSIVFAQILTVFFIFSN
ncbi:hypothetical protein CDAR_175071 [Caerostris darwini]|uniref:Uncharacterized protein n=1 Tax=Caerostris darwini TaxID=1538125 RepID=A0AAV4W3J6_9ARAC|nr:hypothetical protein CDAR_175071 [Caerostris darwini]